MSGIEEHKVGSKVSWHYLSGTVHGHVEEIYHAPVEKMIKGSKIKRNGSVEKPAYLVRSDAGNIALKLHSELF